MEEPMDSCIILEPLLSDDRTRLAMPKSVILMPALAPACSKTMLSNLKSRWIIPASCLIQTRDKKCNQRNEINKMEDSHDLLKKTGGLAALAHA